MNTLASSLHARCRQALGVRYIDIEMRNPRGSTLGRAQLQVVCIDSSLKYPSQPWEGCADLFLAQDELDGYLAGKRGLYGWLDSFEKCPGQDLNLCVEMRGHLARIFERCGNPLEILMYPYPLGVFDEDAVKKGQGRLRAHYARFLGAQPIAGTRLMRLTPP